MKTILAPTDFSRNADEALKYAISFAEKTQRKIIFYHATFQLIPTSEPQAVYEKIITKDIAQKTTELKKKVDEIYTEMGLIRNPDTTRFMVSFERNAVTGILDTTRKHFIDLIIMGTQGASGLKKVFAGSNTVSVIQKTDCPVLAIPAKSRYTTIEHVSFAAGDIKTIKQEVGKVIPYMQMLKSHLEIFHIGDTFGEADEALHAETLRKQIEKKYAFHNLTLTMLRDNGESIDEQIMAHIKTTKPDILCVLTHKRSFWQRIFDQSQASTLAFHSKVPLLVLK